MKRKLKGLGLPILASLAMGTLFMATPARAADYQGDCAGVPNHVTGNAIIGDVNCVIDTGATLLVDGTLTINAETIDIQSDVDAGSNILVSTSQPNGVITTKDLKSRNGDVIVRSTQNRVQTQAITAGNSVQIDAGVNGAENSTWDIKVTGLITANKFQPLPSPSVHGNVLLRAAGAISTKNIRTDGGLADSIKSGGIQIDAFRNGAPPAEFVIGGTSPANGVGSLITKSTVGGGTNPNFNIGGINISNGGRGKVGDIRVIDMGAINVRATQSRSGWIQLNAFAGTIYLPSGKLNADGATGQGAGSIYC